MRKFHIRLAFSLFIIISTALAALSAVPNAAADSFETFSGVVLSSGGQPDAGVLVALSSSASDENGVTAADGSFSVSAQPGVYKLSLQGGGGGGIPAFTVSGPTVDLTQGSVVQDITLPAVATVNVAVLDSSGNPVPGAQLNSQDPSVTFDGYPGGQFTGEVEYSRAVANSSGVASFLSFLGAGSVSANLEGASGSPSVQVTIPAVTANPTNATVYLEPPGQAPAITSAASATTGMRSPFSFTITTTGMPTPAVTETGMLPAGITFTDNGDGTATLTGTPSAGTAGTYPITITASNGIGSPASQSFTLTVTSAASAPTFISNPADTETYGVPFTYTIDTTGYPAPTLKKTGSLPPGVTFTDNGDGTATITGTPSKSAIGNYSLTITASSTAGTATQAFTLTITKAPVIKKIPNTTAAVGTPLSITITAQGEATPALTQSGPLPAGLTFTDNGNGTATIAGTPSPGSGGSYSVTITATNQLGTARQTFTLKVKEGPAITSTGSATTAVGSAFSFQVTATGYPAATITAAGKLPKGVKFTTSTATFTGTPQAGTEGTYPIAITAKNSTSTVTQNFTLTITASS